MTADGGPTPVEPGPGGSMPGGPTLETARLVLRRWKPADKEPFAEMNADDRVMEFFPNTLSREQSDALADRADGRFETYGFGLWAVKVKHDRTFIGFIGLSPFSEEDPDPLPLPAGVEIGWRLAYSSWGQGYAPEGARAALRFGFEEVGLEEIVSFTSTVNSKSRRVMEKIGMRHGPEDYFDHPRVPDDSPLKPHVLYRLGRRDYLASRDG
jgi:3-dehydroquinate dehydratase/shikimate dehydrogenase